MKINQYYFNKIIFIFILLFYYYHIINNRNFSTFIIHNNKFSNNSNLFRKNDLIFNLIQYEVHYFHKLILVKISYLIQIIDSNNNTIRPSDLTLYHDLHILCFIKINNLINIYSLPSVKNDSYFNCQEFFKYNEFFEIGVIIYKTNSSGFIQNNYEEHYINKELFIIILKKLTIIILL